ncbi:HET-domain-containing protein [Lophiostoma macrostomum CBS 122681]|uniref:HET-domain-containing protein n=1 Tax=Lophiostoma macrostomum CBS 122681 TaxID=1314788 RepID=A0A6A6SKY0_9PLEO|nr:HET-domain-containing protein [Lophiostoma macrostomum CBS 122681]
MSEVKRVCALQYGDPNERNSFESSAALSPVALPQPGNAEQYRKSRCKHETQHVPTTDRDIQDRTYRDTFKRHRYYPRVGYIYKPLQPKTMRLLEIYPSKECRSPLSCYLRPVRLGEAPSYEALSYRWCKQDDGFLRCSGQNLTIRRNLKNALTRLRLSDARRAVWADAICINQKDEKEKADQIKLMRKIYSQATRVLVWLGEDPDNEAEQAFVRIEQIAQADGTLPPPQDPWWNPVAAFYRCDWFSRLWVFQEVAMATNADVLWGVSKIPWETVGHASIRIRTKLHQHILHHSMMNVYHGYLFYKWSVNQRDPLLESFLYMLQITRKLHCSNQKDRIYALSGFETVDMSPADFNIDFGVKKSLRSLHQDFARKILGRMQTLDVLSAVQHEPKKPILRKLTWVPKWNICTVDTLGPLGSSYKRYTACQGLTAPLIEWTGNWKQFLHTTGIEFDSIINSTGVISGSTNPEMLSALVAVSTQLFAEISSYPTGEPLHRVCCWTLTAGKDEYGMIVEKEAQHLADFTAFWAKNGHSMQQHHSRPPCGEDIPSGDVDRFLMAAGSACGGRRLFHTSKGYVGIGPVVLQGGDIVCILSRGAMPFVLRRDSHSRRSKRRFALIGEAYVHGIMYGEGVSKYCDGKQAIGTFDIV